MYGIFVNERGAGFYARWIVTGNKTIETRNRDMLSALVGKRVAVVRTRKSTIPNTAPMVVGYVTITGKSFCEANDFHKYFMQHMVSVRQLHRITPFRHLRNFRSLWKQ